jgi:hypothetical protein
MYKKNPFIFPSRPLLLLFGFRISSVSLQRFLSGLICCVELSIVEIDQFKICGNSLRDFVQVDV